MCETPMRTELNGVLLLDKPVGLSSHEALKRAQHLMSAAKAGHTGTLDPLASGLLPLCFGEATKFAQDLLDALARFRGKLLQVPPMYSAVKRNGKPLYAYARRDITLERPARPVTIKTLELLNAELHPSPSAFFSEIAQGASAKTVWGSMRAEQVSIAQRWRRPRSDPEYAEQRSDTGQAAEKGSNPSALHIRVVCSKGTYIRALAQDIGEALGCGAHLCALRRTAVGRFNISDALTLDALDQADHAARRAYLRPMDTLLRTYPAARLDAGLSRRFRQGQRLRLPDDFQLDSSTVPPASWRAHDESLRVRVYDEQEQLLGMGRFTGGVLAPHRLLATA